MCDHNTFAYSSRFIPFSLEERNVEIFNITLPHWRKGALIIQLNLRRLARAIETSRTKSSAKELPH